MAPAVPTGPQAPSPAASPTPAATAAAPALSLEDALRIATGESPEIQAAIAAVERALGSRRVARSPLFPQLQASAGYTRTILSQFSDVDFDFGGDEGDGGEGTDAGDLPFGQENQYSLGLDFQQLLFDGGVTSAQVRAAEARERGAEIEVAATTAQVLLDVTQAYFDAQLSDRLVEIAEASLGQNQETLRQTQVALDVGNTSEYELLRARVARDNQVAAVLARGTERQQSYARLARILGMPVATRARLTTGVDDELPARFAAASTTDPEARAPVRQAAAQVAASEAEIAAARAERLPSVALVSRYAPVAFPRSGFPRGFDDFREDFTVGVSLSVPLLTGGRLRGNEQVARANLAEAEARLGGVRRAAALDALVARGELTLAEATLAGNSATVEEAERAYGIAQVRYREGISTQIELADARLLREQAAVNRARALRDVQVARVRLALLEHLPISAAPGTTFAPTTPQTSPLVPATPSTPGTLPPAVAASPGGGGLGTVGGAASSSGGRP